jgi:nitrate reductase NapE component
MLKCACRTSAIRSVFRLNNKKSFLVLTFCLFFLVWLAMTNNIGFPMYAPYNPFDQQLDESDDVEFKSVQTTTSKAKTFTVMDNDSVDQYTTQWSEDDQALVLAPVTADAPTVELSGAEAGGLFNVSSAMSKFSGQFLGVSAPVDEDAEIFLRRATGTKRSRLTFETPSSTQWTVEAVGAASDLTFKNQFDDDIVIMADDVVSVNTPFHVSEEGTFDGGLLAASLKRETAGAASLYNDNNTTSLQLGYIGTQTTINGSATVAQDLTVTGTASVGGTLGVTGVSTLASLGVTGAATVGTTLGVTGATTLGDTLGVTGASTLASLGVTNNATVGGTLVSTGNITTAASIDKTTSSSLSIGGTNATTLSLGRSGQTQTLLGNVTIPAGGLVLLGDVDTGQTGRFGNVLLTNGNIDRTSSAFLNLGITTATGVLISRTGVATVAQGSLYSTQGFNALSTSALTGQVTMGTGGTSYTLPTTRGTANQCLIDNGSGVVSFGTLAVGAKGIYNFGANVAADPFLIHMGLNTTLGSAGENATTQAIVLMPGTISRISVRHAGDATSSVGIYVNYTLIETIITGGTAGTVAAAGTTTLALGDFLSIKNEGGTNMGASKVSVIVT